MMFLLVQLLLKNKIITLTIILSHLKTFQYILISLNITHSVATSYDLEKHL
jgi:hypothetical protein